MAADDRREYASLLAQYESVTFDEARLISAIDQAHYCGDAALRQLLSVQVLQLSARRHVAHVALLEYERNCVQGAGAA